MSITLIIPVVLGWLAGLIVNYLSDVLPVTRKFSQPACLQCNATYTWKDYLLFRACPNGHQRAPRLWIVQILILAISIYIWQQPPAKIGYFLGLILIIYFGVIFTIDMEHRLILHPTSIFGSVLALIVGLVSHGLRPTLIGGLSGLLIMLAFYYLGVLFAKIRTKRMLARGQEADDEEALGAGDVILVTIIGLMLGWPLIWFGLVFGILLGGLVSLMLVIWLVLTRKYEQNVLMLFIPYGPYFITSAFLIIYFPGLIEKLVPG
ncbi:MAG: prepilin peptidase [Anaerolineales bacterium]|nr:prepilin peptidase [Anaerolineales bacterium]